MTEYGKRNYAHRAGLRVRPNERAGVTMSLSRARRMLKSHLSNRKQRIGSSAVAYTAAVVEYLCAEWLELSGDACKDAKMKRIKPRHMLLAAKNDEELRNYLKTQKGVEITIPNAGRMPEIHVALMKKELDAQKKREEREGRQGTTTKTSSDAQAHSETTEEHEEEEQVDEVANEEKRVTFADNADDDDAAEDDGQM